MIFPRTISSAVSYLASHPELRANPKLLMAACYEWDCAVILELDANASLVPITPDVLASALHQAGIEAAQEVAMPVHKTVQVDNVINPEDLMD